jgi:hypothetical protein
MVIGRRPDQPHQLHSETRECRDFVGVEAVALEARRRKGASSGEGVGERVSCPSLQPPHSSEGKEGSLYKARLSRCWKSATGSL